MDNNNKSRKRIAILGSTGSIGTQALEVIEEHSDLYEAYILTANNQVDKLIEQARKYQPEAVVIANEAHYGKLQEALSGLPIKIYAGAKALEEKRRIAESIANTDNCLALITGESVGQVASQTVESLRTTNEVCKLP